MSAAAATTTTTANGTSSPSSTLRIVTKSSYDKQHLFPIPHSSLPPLAPQHARIQPTMLGLMSTNLAYCAAGDLLHWYSAYPLLKTAPKGTLPPKFEDASRFAVPVGWGYAVVKESNVEGLPVGKRVYGMLPMCDVPVDVKVVASEGGMGKHWIEVSEHREKMMEIYKRYIVVEEDYAKGVPEGWREWRCGAFVVSQCGFLLNQYCFAARKDGPVLSVFPGVVEWSGQDADLSQSVVITLGSGSRTCRSFVQQLAGNRDADCGPVALVEVTESGGFVADLKPHFKHRTVGYKAIVDSETMQWLAALEAKVSRTVVIDFGGRGNAISDQLQRLRESQMGKKVQLIAVGSEPKVYTAEELQAGAARKAEQKAIQLNTSPIIDALMKEIGEYEAHELLSSEWRRVVESEQARNEKSERAGMVLGLQLDVRKGVRGKDGLEGAWSELCEGRMRSNTACVIAL